MATSAAVTTDLTTCPICLEVFDNPKSLPCLHAFCLKCLQGYFKDKSVGDKAPCPMCRKEFQIPSDGLDGLQHHFFIQRLVDVQKVSSEEFGEVLCEVCRQENEGTAEGIPTAIVYCVDCNQKLCERCGRPHKRMTGGGHRLKPLGPDVEQELVQLRACFCHKHTDKRVELYCHQCNENVCLMCFTGKHRQHENGEIPQVAEYFRPKIEADGKQILSAISSVGQLLEHVKQEVNKFMSDVDGVEKTVLEAGEEIKRIVDSQIRELVSQLHTVKSDGAKRAQTVKDQLQLALVAMESFHRYSQELLDKGRPSDVTRAANELHNRAMELLKNDVTTINFRPPHVTFAPADVTQLTGLWLVGKVTIESGDQPGRPRPIIILHSKTSG